MPSSGQSPPPEAVRLLTASITVFASLVTVTGPTSIKGKSNVVNNNGLDKRQFYKANHYFTATIQVSWVFTPKFAPQKYLIHAVF